MAAECVMTFNMLQVKDQGHNANALKHHWFQDNGYRALVLICTTTFQSKGDKMR